jgi:1,4-alpha-glucan branching enzyme
MEPRRTGPAPHEQGEEKMAAARLIIPMVLALWVTACGDTEANVTGAALDGTSARLSDVPMGAQLSATGATFRVWAQRADSVDVTGDFGTVAMSAVGDGTWVASVDGVTAGQSYAFNVHSGAQVRTRADPRAQQIINDPGGAEPTSVLYDQGAYAWRTGSFRAPPPSQQVLYELHIGSFSDTSGPGTGTYASAAAKLADLADLGVNVVEVLPVNEFPGRYSWGYNPTYPFAPASAYGAPDDFKAFVDEAHARGIAVVLDVVHNHYYRDSTSDEGSLSMWCFDGPCPGNGGDYFDNDGTPWGPRPDFAQPAVHDFVVDSTVSWVKNFHVDGFRWDSSIYTRRTDWNVSAGHDIAAGARVMKDMNIAVHAANPNALTVAEDLAGWDAITSSVDRSRLDDYASGFGFDSQWDDGFFYTLKGVMTQGDDGSRDVNALAGALRTSYGGVATHRVIYTEDHDKVAPQNGSDKQRIPEAIWPGHADSYWSRKRASLGAAVALTAPGIPMLFMGQEMNESKGFPFSQDQALDWSNADRFSGIRALYKDLIHARLNAQGNTAGLTGNSLNVFHVNTNNKVVGYHRWNQGGAGDDVVVVVNFSNQAFPSYTLGFPRGGTWHVRLNSDWNGYSSDFPNTPSDDAYADAQPRDGLNYSGSIGIGPYTVIVLSQ